MGFVNDENGFGVIFDSRYTLSVRGGPFNLCSRIGEFGPFQTTAVRSEDCEISAWTPDDRPVKLVTKTDNWNPSKEIAGYVSPEGLAQIMVRLGTGGPNKDVSADLRGIIEEDRIRHGRE